MTVASEAFFVAGGTVPPGSPSYVERSADRELFEALLSGEYCYVLNSRQMGKSSLAVRVMQRLNEAGVRCAFVDLTKIGASGVTEEQWYVGILAEVGRTLGLRKEVVSHLREHSALSPSQRLITFLQEAVAGLGEPVTLFVDEVDAVRSLSFSTDALFAGIRQCWNARSTDPDLGRLTFCLMGAALPADLIRDVRMTPFNVGRRVELRDFTAEEASAFELGLSSRLRRPAAALASEPASAPVARVMHWTGGHPFLTQSLCSALAEPTSQEHLNVDALVRERYLDARARETDTNLADVGNRLLGRGDPNVGDAERADTLSLYEKLLKGGIPDDKSNPSCARIKMSGVARLEQGQLKIRNRIYQEVFGKAWIRENMPGQELRRQKRAFWKGALRTGALSALVVGIISALAVFALISRNEAIQARREVEYELYASRMFLVGDAWNRNDLDKMVEILRQTEGSPHRGLEWNVWQSIGKAKTRCTWSTPWGVASELSPDGLWVSTVAPGGVEVHDALKGQLAMRVENLGKNVTCQWASNDSLFVADGERVQLLSSSNGRPVWELKDHARGFADLARGTLFLSDTAGGTLRLRELDRSTGKVLQTFRPGLAAAEMVPLGRERLVITWIDHSKVVGKIWNIQTGATRDLGPIASTHVGVSPGGRYLSYRMPDKAIVVRNANTLNVVSRIRPAHEATTQMQFSEDGSLLGVAFQNLSAAIYDTKTGRVLRTYKGSPTIGISQRSNSVLTAYRDVRIFDLDTPTESSIQLEKGHWVSLKPEQDGRIGAIAPDMDATVALEDTPKVTLRNLPEHTTIGETPYRTDRLLLSGTKIAKVEPARPQAQAREVKLPFAALKGTLSRNGEQIAVLREDGASLAVVDLNKQRTVWQLTVTGGCTAPVFSPDGGYVALGEDSGAVLLFRAADGLLLEKYEAHEYSPIALRFSRSGKKVLSLGDDDKAVLIDVVRHRMTPLLGHSYSVGGGDISPDETRAVTASTDYSVMIWDTATGKPLTKIPLPKQAVDARFIQNGRALAVLTGSEIYLWSCEPEERR